MSTGSVKWFSPTRGYGLVVPDDGSRDLFVPIDAIERSGVRALPSGQKISYQTITDRRTGRRYIDRLRPI